MTSPYGALSDELEGLRWKTQHASHDRNAGNDLLHYAMTGQGSFEIFDAGDDLLLHFPRSLRMPSEHFTSLDAAKARALAALRSLQTGNAE